MDGWKMSFLLGRPIFRGYVKLRGATGLSLSCWEGLVIVLRVRLTYPWGSMYGIFTYTYHENQSNVGKYTIHGSSGYWHTIMLLKRVIFQRERDSDDSPATRFDVYPASIRPGSLIGTSVPSHYTWKNSKNPTKSTSEKTPKMKFFMHSSKRFVTSILVTYNTSPSENVGQLWIKPSGRQGLRSFSSNAKVVGTVGGAVFLVPDVLIGTDPAAKRCQQLWKASAIKQIGFFLLRHLKQIWFPAWDPSCWRIQEIQIVQIFRIRVPPTCKTQPLMIIWLLKFGAIRYPTWSPVKSLAHYRGVNQLTLLGSIRLIWL